MRRIKILFKNYAGANEDFSRAIEINLNFWMLTNSEEAQNIVKDYEGAIEDYSKVLEIDPNNSAALKMRRCKILFKKL